LLISELSADLDCINELNASSEFSFIIFGDNHGYATENTFFSRMDAFRVQSNALFAIGVGDHVKGHRFRPFLHLIVSDEWWHNNFFPNIADGENELFGTSQGDWGSGGELLNYVSFAIADTVYFRENGAEYYALIKIGDFNIHIMQLHFPDTPMDVRVSFKQESRDYMIAKLNSITKSKYDIIIVVAHSMSGFWHHLLTAEEQRILLTKSDIILSGTSHVFDRVICPLNGEDGALILNAGSVTDPLFNSAPGYIQVNVLREPAGIMVQYIDLRNVVYQIAPTEYRFFRYMLDTN
jgi:predicted phosphodiesterase